MAWLLDEKIQQFITGFDFTHLNQINESHYFKEYNEHDDLINCIALRIPYRICDSTSRKPSGIRPYIVCT
ncbi:hypothetical protein AKG37_02550 [Bacillus australimaris]|uniref:Transposase n=1 Tax=Bacillus australimaris TaxID=1326968 RepID=A0ABD4QE58_9BACI|nr:hypothetical protein [Bacillus australimaris]KPN15722.1 hypothetical protein AKG37_02550 [Bacillus australimaris]MBR8688679.1 hypothetical protein [Bacillus australimaris]